MATVKNPIMSGFTGCTMGVYAEGFGTGYAKFTNTCLK